MDENLSLSRPTSPAEEADETLTPTEEGEYKKMEQCRRKSSVWKKALNFKKQISKVNTKIGEGVRRGSAFFGPTEGTLLSPVEISPPDTSADKSQVDRQDFIGHLEKDIIQTLSEANCNKNPLEDKTIEEQSGSNSETDSECDLERRSSYDSDKEWKKKIMSQPQSLQYTRRPDASEEGAAHMSFLQSNQQTRPSELSLFDENGRPLAPPRQRLMEGRSQRLLSVPNIKYHRKDSVRPEESCRSKLKKDVHAPSSFAGNLIRRFSKY